MSASSKVFTRYVAVGGALWAFLAVSAPHGASAAIGGPPLRTITPTAATTVDNILVDPTCDSQGGTSMAIVQGSKLVNVDPVQYPVLLATSCLDNGGSASAIERRSRINFLDPSAGPSSGKVIKSITTKIAGITAAPSNGWAHWVHRPDVGDLLGCGNDGTIHSVDFSQFNSVADGTATPVPRPAGLPANCVALGWDPEEDMIYQGVTGSNAVIGVHRFKSGTTALLGSFNTPCTPSGAAITGGVLVVACDGLSTILRLDKNTGAILSVNGTLGILGLPAGTALNPDLGDLACDPTTFQKHPTTGKDQFKDAMWSRRGANGNGAVALEFPAFTCGLPSNATVFAAGLSAPAGGQPGAVPLAACFDGNGNVIDTDDDGLPDCWETNGIDFDGDGIVDLQLSVQVDTNGDGVLDATEPASPTHKDLFVEIDWLQFHKPDPLALSQAQSVASIGVKSVREAFAAAPVSNPSPPPPLPPETTGIRIHFQVDEQVTFTTLAGTLASHVDQLVFTPCTPPANSLTPLGDAADFDTIKKANFGTAAERPMPADSDAVKIAKGKTLNAKRLAFRYVLFAHKQVSLNQASGATNSGCAELGGDDAAVTLGGFTTTTVGGVSHARGTTDQQAGTVMHELGHTLGLRHGGFENVNCKPNYLSVMSYSRQFPGSPIPNRRLDYSRAVLPDLNEQSLNELVALGGDASLSAIASFFPSADQTAFGPGAWSVVAANAPPINWDRSKQGPNPTYQNSASADINQGPGGCDGAGGGLAPVGLQAGTPLEGHNDWGSLLFRPSAALDFAGGVHTTDPELVSITQKEEEDFFLAADQDPPPSGPNGVPDAQDCLTFLCTHRIDIKPADAANTVSIGENVITVAIFSEVNGTTVWDAVALVVRDASLTFNGLSAKLNKQGQGTCSARDVPDPVTGIKDGIKDLLCQFPTTGLVLGTQFGVVSGLFLVPGTNPPETRAFRARQVLEVVK